MIDRRRLCGLFHRLAVLMGLLDKTPLSIDLIWWILSPKNPLEVEDDDN